jgi:hypothetical protein
MEVKNDWYLKECEHILIADEFFFMCTYSNGLTLRKFYIRVGKDIPTVMSNEMLIDGLKEFDKSNVKLYADIRSSR